MDSNNENYVIISSEGEIAASLRITKEGNIYHIGKLCSNNAAGVKGAGTMIL